MVAQSGHPPPLSSRFHFHRTSTSIGFPLPSDFHFHRPSTFTPLFLCACAYCFLSHFFYAHVFCHMSDGSCASECSTTPADKRRNYSNCFPSAPVNARLQRTRVEIIRIVFRHMSVGVLSMLCSNAFFPGNDQINMVVVLLLALCAPVNALPLQRTRDEIISSYYTYCRRHGYFCAMQVEGHSIATYLPSHT